MDSSFPALESEILLAPRLNESIKNCMHSTPPSPQPSCDVGECHDPHHGLSKPTVDEKPNVNESHRTDQDVRMKANKSFLPEYPKYGVIGPTECIPINLFCDQLRTRPTPKEFRKQKFDFHEMYEKDTRTDSGIIKSATPLPGLGYLSRGFKTSDIYKVDPALPKRFQNPDLLHGYGCEREEHPLFRTTSSEYGKFGPTVHDVPHVYNGLKNTFTSHLARSGMPKNRSLNIK